MKGLLCNNLSLTINLQKKKNGLNTLHQRFPMLRPQPSDPSR
jgi:hypothetical protein